MKFIHLSDLHIGKRINEYSMLEDQAYILSSIIDIIDSVKPEAVIIAGDVYDKAIPSAEAVQLFDDFLVKLSERSLHVFVISGNHDSPERISFGARLMEKSGIHLSPVYDGHIKSVTLKDTYGSVHIHMLPFIKPAHVRRFYDEEDVVSYTDAVRVALSKQAFNKNERNILITHQFVTGAQRTESEEISVGGSDNVDLSVFEGFDYVALGHIHRPQSCGADNIRYSGTPLKYSFSEAKDKKSVTVVELFEKGTVKISQIPLVPLRDMHEIKGTYNSVMMRDFYKDTTYTEDYMHITLTDEDDIPDAIGRLRTVYHNLMKLDYDNLRTRGENIIDNIKYVESKTPLEHFSEFYELQNNQPMSQMQHEFIKNLIENLGEDL
jgi:exonuclease SbcD